MESGNFWCKVSGRNAAQAAPTTNTMINIKNGLRESIFSYKKVLKMCQILFRLAIYYVFTDNTTYGPTTPSRFDKIKPSEMPVWRRHVGYVSTACKYTEKTATLAQNLITIDSAIEYTSHSESVVKFKCIRIVWHNHNLVTQDNESSHRTKGGGHEKYADIRHPTSVTIAW